MPFLFNFGVLFVRIYRGSRVVSDVDRKLGAFMLLWAIAVIARMHIRLKQQHQHWGNLLRFRLLKPIQISALSCALQLRIYGDFVRSYGIHRCLFGGVVGDIRTQKCSYVVVVVVVCTLVHFRRILLTFGRRDPSQAVMMMAVENCAPHGPS